MDLNQCLCLNVNNYVALVITVEDNINKYTVGEYSSVKKARARQNIIGRPATKDLIALEVSFNKTSHTEGR